MTGSCASSYKTINPAELSYNSGNQTEEVSIEYKYDLLRKKYAKKEDKNDIRLVALKITNNTKDDLVFDRDLQLTYTNNNGVMHLTNDKVFKALKQKPAWYLFYLLLTPMQFSTTTTNANGMQQTSSSFPAGLIVGPGLAGGNLIGASMANKKFKEELMTFDLRGRNIPKGKTVYGLVGLRADNYDALQIKLKEDNATKEEKSDITP